MLHVTNNRNCRPTEILQLFGGAHLPRKKHREEGDDEKTCPDTANFNKEGNQEKGIDPIWEQRCRGDYGQGEVTSS